MFKILLVLLISIFSYAKEFTIASYNVENLFDLTKQNSEYREFIPNTKSNWNQKTFNIKLNNIIKVLKEIDADIIALQEIENKALMQMIMKKLPEYKYYSFTKYQKSAVGLGFLSKVKIKNNKQIDVKFSNKLFRPILESTFEIENIEFKVFNNHWPSKRVSESYRIKFAKKLQDRLNKLPKDYDYILLGDFNSNYNEMQSFRNDKRLNNTDGITGINQVLNTTIDKKYITYDDVLTIKKRVHFNLWLEKQAHQRFSNKFRKQSNTPDNIILAPALLDTKKISYIPNSFEVYKPEYLYKNHRLNRWQMKGNKNNKQHIGAGYSDHLPIFAKFSTSKNDSNPIKKIIMPQTQEISKISDLYKKEKLIETVTLKNVVVIYKNKSSAVVKQKNDRAIYIYKDADKLILGNSYSLRINEIIDYNGLKEIKEFKIVKNNGLYQNYRELFIDANKINILKSNYQNEIIKDLKGEVKNKKLYFNNKSIKIYAKNKSNIPPNNSTITIKTGHLGVYRGNPQILIHKKSDYKVEF